MARASNTITIAAIGDSETLHGSLLVSRSLTQGYDKQKGTQSSAWTPNWETANTNDKPLLYLLLSYGNSYMLPISHTWMYNGVALSFDPTTHLSTTNFAGVFKEDEFVIGTYHAVALRIMKNLAGPGNLNIDSIAIDGTTEMNGVPLSFHLEQKVNVYELNANGYVGVIDFLNGKSVLNGSSDTVTATANLYVGGSTPSYTVEWKLSGVTIPSNSTKLSNTGKTVTLTGNDVDDIGVLTAVFKDSNGNVVATAKETIDDIADPIYLYIKSKVGAYNNNAFAAGVQEVNCKDVILRKGQAVEFQFYMGSTENPNTKYTEYTKYEILPYTINKQPLPAASLPSYLQNKTSVDGCIDVTEGPTGGKYGKVLVMFEEMVALGGFLAADVYASKPS